MSGDVQRKKATYDWPIVIKLSGRILLNFILLVLCLLTALAVIKASHHTREQYGELQRLESEFQQLQTVYGQLLLEQSTWSAPTRIEGLASGRLEMRLPDIEEIEVVRP
ncbi:cell division protein FtsL [Halomonas halocynthiae]|uniref:cell division protein FtsL n=1 Tax=Halomonas halocynthiae TaxID=176290 RepID=UPI0003FC5B29|nr:cell division protein FtsL [Halomonas halocynthiae]